MPEKWNQLSDRAVAALVPKDAFAPDAPWSKDIPAAPGEIVAQTSGVAGLCGDVEVKSGMRVTRHRFWSGPHKVVWEDVHALSEDKAADLLDRVREKARACTSYVRKEGKPERVVTPDVAMDPPPAGFDDLYAFCETAPDVQEGQHNCQAYLARGNLLVNFGTSVFSDDPVLTRGTAQQQLKEMLPIVAQAAAAA
ncbi:hypothetical protein [Lentzea sp. NBRC 102530]|uniref:hypothetical protein n=1 Tax=Lentzea sp. NBRC 102530 TaxID=3032201 RepID=UPI0024A0E36B|nr:hypothetical protein [Lentzea sp. NBRC 102530]GLY49583.1 hypothetical protein Lesp01_32390 [Lentzea sp. NBRC 102530]